MAKVLVVDDNPADMLNLRGMLERAGHQVITASSGSEAVETVRTQALQAVFMDVVMENMDGYRATREIMEQTPDKAPPIIMVTSKNQKADKVWAQLQGAKGYVVKPYTQEQILEALSQALNSAAG